jgi:catechol-2,3-dioxygenase
MIKRINNITLAVSDLKETTSFYENVLSLKKTAEWKNYVTFDVGGVDLAFEPGGRKGRVLSIEQKAKRRLWPGVSQSFFLDFWVC